MNMTKQINSPFVWISMLLLALFSAGCEEFKEPQFVSFNNFDYSLMEKGNIPFSVDVAINNPNNFGYRLKLKQLEAYLGDELLGALTIDNQIKLLKNSTSTHHITGRFEKSPGLDPLSLGKKLLFSENDNYILARGRVVGKKFIIKKNKDFEFRRDVNLRKLIQQISGL